MVQHTQTIHQQFGDELFECIWPFCGIGAQRVKYEKLKEALIIRLVKEYSYLSTENSQMLRPTKNFW